VHPGRGSAVSIAIVLAQFIVAGALLACGWWGRRVTVENVRMVGDHEDRFRRARACRQGAVACVVCGVLVALASVVTAGQIVADRMG
jgi:hypothetical protein